MEIGGETMGTEEVVYVFEAGPDDTARVVEDKKLDVAAVVIEEGCG